MQSSKQNFVCVFVCWFSAVCKAPVLFLYTLPSLFQEAHMFMTAENVEDVTEEKMRAELCKAQAQAPSQWVRRSSRSAEKEELVVRYMQCTIWPLDGDIYYHKRDLCSVIFFLVCSSKLNQFEEWE